MNWPFIGFTLDVIGKILLGLTVLLVHRRIVKEHRFDGEVLRQMRQEQLIGGIAIALIIAGFILQAPSKFSP